MSEFLKKIPGDKKAKKNNCRNENTLLALVLKSS
jgi:hypothetical protein